jgi:hypothetical protein
MLKLEKAASRTLQATSKTAKCRKLKAESKYKKSRN